MAPGSRQNPPPLHVVHIIESLGSGGAERLLHTNLQILTGEAFRHTVVTVGPERGFWSGPIRALGADVLSLDAAGYSGIPSAIWRFRRWLRRSKPDLIHSHLLAANLVGRIAGRLTRIPVISSIHSPDHEPEVWEDGSNVPLWKRWVIQTLDATTAGLACERMIAVSEYVKQSTHERLGYPLDRIAVITNPVDLDEIDRAMDGNREGLLDELGLAPDSRLLLSVARVSPAKGLLFAVRALPAIVREHPEAHLIAVGSMVDGGWLKMIRQEAAALGVEGNLHFLGERGDIPTILRSCDLFVFPSTYEGLGIALVEAMASGLPCVASRIGPIPSFLDDGRTGLLVPPADPAALAGAVNGLLADPERAHRMGVAAAVSARGSFAPGPAAERLAGIYQQVGTRGREIEK